MDNVEKILTSYREEMMETLQKWIKVPSVRDEPAPGAPFGRENRRMLEMAMEDCERMGFHTEIIDGYAGHADLGQGDDRAALGILAHLDVVPTGDGWARDPFGGQRIGGNIYGRGTSDDKGPAVAALYAMRAVKEAGIPLRRKVRLILGCDEECGSSDMEYYKEHAVMPRSGFSPDADYPLINIENGRCVLKIAGKPAGTGLQVISMHVGERHNVVPGFASALVEGNEELVKMAEEAAKKLGIDAQARMENGAVRLEITGVTGHAAFPYRSKNAAGQMLLLMKELGAEGAIRELADLIGVTVNGENLGIAMEDGISGKLTCSLGILNMDADEVAAGLDIRFPVLFNPETMVKVINMRLSSCKLTVESCRGPHYVDEKTELVQELLEAYHEVTGGEKKAIAIGGGTYAQSMEEGVAFGAKFPEETEMAHQANEFISEESVMRNAVIFARAIIRLAGKN